MNLRFAITAMATLAMLAVSGPSRAEEGNANGVPVDKLTVVDENGGAIEHQPDAEEMSPQDLDPQHRRHYRN